MSVAIVGGGIAGLYCARELLGGGACDVTLFEKLDRVGGRIETETADLDGFVAEYGPMRFEPKLQPLFARLCDELGGVELVYFPGPSAADRDTTSVEYPDVAPFEKDAAGKPLDALSLLKLGVFRMFDHKRRQRAHTYLKSRESWLQGLDLLPSYPPRETNAARTTAQKLREEATVPTDHLNMKGKYWHELGLWNALSEVLSHEAILRIRDFGTFYHLIPDNPNAIEWAIFWLRLFQLGDEPLATVRSGTSTLVEKLNAELCADPACTVLCEHEVVSLKARRAKVIVEARTGKPEGPGPQAFDHVILALPRHPLKQLEQHLPQRVATRLDSVIGFPLLKVFAVVRNATWLRYPLPEGLDRDTEELMLTGQIPFMSQRRAGRIPTREIHYYMRKKDRVGMAMLYTDHPATEYWKVLLADKMHTRARICAPTTDLPALAGALRHYLRFDYAERTEIAGDDREAVRRRRPHKLVKAAIRDWSRDPFGAGAHVWKPGERSGDVRKEFKQFALEGSPAQNVHICGEAYSDYQGFIEGALQSAMDALLTLPVPTRTYPKRAA